MLMNPILGYSCFAWQIESTQMDLSFLLLYWVRKGLLWGTNSLRFVKEMFHKSFLKSGLLTDLALGSDFKTLQFTQRLLKPIPSLLFMFCTIWLCSFWYRSGDPPQPCWWLITELLVKATDWLYLHHVLTRLSMTVLCSPSLTQGAVEICVWVHNEKIRYI